MDENNTYYFDIDGIKKYIELLDGQRAVVFGFTYILYSEVIKPFIEKGMHFSLPQGSKVIHIGGWKKLENEKVSKDQFNRLVAEVFGVEKDDVIDIYGFTEQMGLNYPVCPCGCKHAPLYSEVIVRDVISKKVLPPGKEGLLEFVTPIPHSYPGNVVLTDDIGMLEEGICKCGRNGTRFKVLGRLKKAEIRGCGDILSSKLKFSDSSVDSVKDDKDNSFRIYYKGNIEFGGQSTETIIWELGKALNDSLSWIRMQPIDALIGLISKVSKKWSAKADVLSETQEQGLQFLVSWCSPENLSRIANDGLRGNRKYADGFWPMDDNAIRLLKSTSKGLVCHWLAGNVQVLGMFVLIQSILTKNVNLLRMSSRDNGTFELLLSAFENESYTTPGGYTIEGNELLKTIALVFFEHSNKKAGKKMSEIADARIAWG